MCENMNQLEGMEQTLTPEKAAAIAEALTPVFEKIARKFRELAEIAGEVIANIAKAITQTWGSVVDRMLYEANDNPKWWHLYKHAKKYRTRKKYRRRLMQQLFSKLGAASAQEA